MDEKRIYMDHAAGVQPDKRVLAAMQPFFSTVYGNPSALYAEGVRARRALEEARERVAACLGAQPDEIVFTSGGTESDNLALRGVPGNGCILTSHLEHPAVTETLTALAAQGREVRYLPVSEDGFADMDALEEHLRQGGVDMVTLMHANHETGVVQPVRRAATLVHRYGGRLLCDAVQSVTCLPIDVAEMDVDYLSLSGHKLGTPRGIGLLYVRRGCTLTPLLYGGGQENGRRSGTESVAAAVGLATALSLACERREARRCHVRALRAQLLAGLGQIRGVRINGCSDPERHLDGIVNASFDCVPAGPLVLWMDRHGVAVSAGSACSSAGKHPSAVLLAMGRSEEEAMSAIRFSLGEKNTAEEVDEALRVLQSGVQKLRELDVVGSVRYGNM